MQAGVKTMTGMLCNLEKGFLFRIHAQTLCWNMSNQQRGCIVSLILNCDSRQNFMTRLSKMSVRQCQTVITAQAAGICPNGNCLYAHTSTQTTQTSFYEGFFFLSEVVEHLFS